VTAASCRSRQLARHDLVVLDRELALDEEVVVLGIEARPLDIVAGEGADVVERAPERERGEACELSVVAAQQQRAEVARRLPVVAQPGLAQVGDVVVTSLARGRAAPRRTVIAGGGGCAGRAAPVGRRRAAR